MSLEETRRRIEEIDKNIVELISKRLKLVEEIAKIKARGGLGIVDDMREVELKILWRRYATSYGVPLSLVERIFSVLLSYSKDIQFNVVTNRECYEHAKACGAIAIIGYGRMARALGMLLVNKGYEVIISGRDIGKAKALAKDVGCIASRLDDALRNSRYVLLTLSPRAFEERFIDKIAGELHEKIVMDILSAKGSIYKHLEELSKIHHFYYISVHPLFGPSTPAAGQKIVLIPSETGTEFVNEVVKLWKCASLDPLVTSFEEHEKAMSIVQVLTHLLILVFEASLNELSRKLSVDYIKFSTPTFKEFLAITFRLDEIRDVVLEIQKNNIFSPLVRETVLEIVKRVISQLGDA